MTQRIVAFDTFDGTFQCFGKIIPGTLDIGATLVEKGLVGIQSVGLMA